MKVDYDVSELNVYAELSPGTDFDPKQLESLKRRCDRRIQHTHTHIHTQPHECIPAHNKSGGGDALFQLKTAQKPVCERHTSLSLQRQTSEQIFRTVVLISVTNK